MPVKRGDRVKITYVGKLDDNTVFDSSEGKPPLEFEVGAGQMIKGFDNAVVGMEKGEGKKIHILPKDAYGEVNREMQQRIPRNKLPQDRTPEVGMVLSLTSEDNKKIPARISEVTEHAVVLDFNHPLAGKALNFEIELVEICEK